MTEPELRLPRQVYRLRIFGLALGFICIATVFYERGASPAAWGLLAAHGLVWPHAAWSLAKASADPHRAERVDPAVLARLFHPFQTTKAAGLGLGLSICQSLVEANGGRVGAGPHPAGAALFFFDLPVAGAGAAS